MQIQVSTIIPVYNREATIERCIRSVMNQTIQPFEIIVVDDGSTDKTLEIIDGLECNLLRVIKQNHRGAQAARNIGILNARGDYIAFLDSDDEWLPQILEKEIEVLSKETEERIIYSDCYICRKRQKRLWKLPGQSGDMYKFLLLHPGPMFQSLLVKKELLFKIGLLDENIVAYQEWDTAIRLAKEVEFAHICEPLFMYYSENEGSISKEIEKSIQGYTYIIKKFQKEIIKWHGLEGLFFHYKKIFEKCLECENKATLIIAWKILYIKILHYFTSPLGKIASKSL